MALASGSMDDLRTEWTNVFAHTLPSLAHSKSPSQPHWPVHLDHCFGRIILDAVIGIDAPWTAKLKGPAVKNMTAEQLQACIALGRRIAEGLEDLCALDERSLELRGKTKAGAGGKRKGDPDVRGGQTKKRKTVEVQHSGEGWARSSRQPRGNTQLDIRASMGLKMPQTDDAKEGKEPKLLLSPPPTPPPNHHDLRSLIQTSHLTPFRKRTLLALCQVPEGQYTTYAALSDFLGSCARAVGNAMRNNPFAPRVPCHRVVASDAGIGGFGGDWGPEGKHVREKVRLLREEGVGVVEEMGKNGQVVLKVKGRVWREFR